MVQVDRMIKSKLGMTFVEVIIAMAIFAILVVAVFPAFLIGIKLNGASQDAVTTSTKAQEVVEQIYEYSLDNTLVETNVILQNLYGAPILSGNTKTYYPVSTEYTIAIVLTPDDPDIGMTRVIVTVSRINNPYDTPPAQAETILLFE